VTGYRPWLDGLRAVAVLMVVVQHTMGRMPIDLRGVGVGLFFALSGYLITSLLLDDLRARARLSAAGSASRTNRKRVLRVMRERKLIQRQRPLERRKRPGFFRVERPRQLWQLEMTSHIAAAAAASPNRRPSSRAGSGNSGGLTCQRRRGARHYLTWHLNAAWAPLLFKDEQPPTAADPSPRPAAPPRVLLG
jgi:hypothetical protein